MKEIIEEKANDIRRNIKKRFTQSLAEDIFGLILKKNKEKDGDLDLYNIYDKKSGELLLPKLRTWEVDDLFRQFGYDIANILQKTACVDTNTEAVDSVEENFKMKQSQYESEYYRTCPICHLKYNSQYQAHSHF